MAEGNHGSVFVAIKDVADGLGAGAGIIVEAILYESTVLVGIEALDNLYRGPWGWVDVEGEGCRRQQQYRESSCSPFHGCFFGC